jgi:hypothetical protein
LHLSIEFSIDKKGFSIYKAKDFLITNPCLFGHLKTECQKIVKEIEKELSEKQVIIKNVIEQRNKIHIHIDKNDIDESADNVFTNFPVELKEIESLLECLCICVSKFLYYYDNKEDPYLNFNGGREIKLFLTDRNYIDQSLNIEEILNKLKF